MQGRGEDRVGCTKRQMLGLRDKGRGRIVDEHIDRRLAKHRIHHGIDGSATISTRQMEERAAARDLLLEGHSPNEGGAVPNATYGVVTPSYFKVMGIPLLRGRSFARDDDQQHRRVAVISKTMAENYWPNVDPIGQRFKLGNVNSESASTSTAGANDWITIIGVAGNVRQGLAVEVPNRPEFYLSYVQQPGESRDMALIVHSRSKSIVSLVRREVAALDPQLPIFQVLIYDEIVSHVFGPKRLALVLLATFAGIALLLVTIGLYAIIAYSVTQRRQEIGIRVAVGAQNRDVLKLILSHGVRLTIFGIAIGVIGALTLTRLMSSLLYGVSAGDLSIYAIVTTVLSSAALFATYFPARRALKIDPIVALRSE